MWRSLGTRFAFPVCTKSLLLASSPSSLPLSSPCPRRPAAGCGKTMPALGVASVPKVDSLGFQKNNCCTKSASDAVQEVFVETGEKGENCDLNTAYRNAMSKVPQPVIIVTAAEYHPKNQIWLKRGITCSSFTSASLNPPIISFCINQPSRLHDLLTRTKHFAVHVLAKRQVMYGVHFSKPLKNGSDQFASVVHEMSSESVPIISGSAAVLHCKVHCIHFVGDHCIWYGRVHRAAVDDVEEPIMYFSRAYRSIGDEIFLRAIEDATLPIEYWTHESRIRLAWNYIREYGREEATPLIKHGIKHYQDEQQGQIHNTYHRTITEFYIHMIADAMKFNHPESTFEEFLDRNSYLMQRDLIFDYYKNETISHDDAKYRFLLPDKKSLP